MKGELRTRSGEHVRFFEIPPFKLLPEVVGWGDRAFCLREPFNEKNQKPIYYEVCVWSVDASDIVVKRLELR